MLFLSFHISGRPPCNFINQQGTFNFYFHFITTSRFQPSSHLFVTYNFIFLFSFFLLLYSSFNNMQSFCFPSLARYRDDTAKRETTKSVLLFCLVSSANNTKYFVLGFLNIKLKNEKRSGEAYGRQLFINFTGEFHYVNSIILIE